jgi:hypothetical protein
VGITRTSSLQPGLGPWWILSDWFTKRTTLVANVQLMRLKRRRGSGWEKYKNFYATGFDALVKRVDKHISVGGKYFEK